MGFFSGITNIVNDVVDTAGDIGQKGIDLTKEALKPALAVGKWSWENPVEAAALGAAGWYFAPQISAWVSPSTGQAVVGTSGGVEAGAEALSGIDFGGVGASPNTWTGAGTYGAVPAAISSTTGATIGAAAGKSLTAGEVINAVRGGLLVNALTGDPLGLNETGSNSVADTGFDIVPIPSDWKSPKYTYTPVQNVTFEDLFPGVSLRGTQWSGMKRANPNMTFNEMFASGLQQTPMGTPVDINQIVGSIVGQGTKS